MNFTPRGNVMVPVPYPVVDFAGHDDGYTPSVRFTGQRAMLLRSFTQHAHGDAQGTWGAWCRARWTASASRSATRRRCAEGSPVVRHLDRCWMTKRNTVGEALFVRDTAAYPAPKDTDPIPGSGRRPDSHTAAARRPAYPCQMAAPNRGRPQCPIRWSVPYE